MQHGSERMGGRGMDGWREQRISFPHTPLPLAPSVCVCWGHVSLNRLVSLSLSLSLPPYFSVSPSSARVVCNVCVRAYVYVRMCARVCLSPSPSLSRSPRHTSVSSPNSQPVETTSVSGLLGYVHTCNLSCAMPPRAHTHTRTHTYTPGSLRVCVCVSGAVALARVTRGDSLVPESFEAHVWVCFKNKRIKRAPPRSRWDKASRSSVARMGIACWRYPTALSSSP